MALSLHLSQAIEVMMQVVGLKYRRILNSAFRDLVLFLMIFSYSSRVIGGDVPQKLNSAPGIPTLSPLVNPPIPGLVSAKTADAFSEYTDPLLSQGPISSRESAKRVDTATKAYLLRYNYSHLDAIAQRTLEVQWMARKTAESLMPTPTATSPGITKREQEILNGLSAEEKQAQVENYRAMRDAYASKVAAGFDQAMRDRKYASETPMGTIILKEMQGALMDGSGAYRAVHGRFDPGSITRGVPWSVDSLANFGKRIDYERAVKEGRVNVSAPSNFYASYERPYSFFENMARDFSDPEIGKYAANEMRLVTKNERFDLKDGSQLLRGNAPANEAFNNMLRISRLEHVVASSVDPFLSESQNREKKLNAINHFLADIDAKLKSGALTPEEAKAAKETRDNLTEAQRKELSDKIDENYAPLLQGAEFLAAVLPGREAKLAFTVAGKGLAMHKLLNKALQGVVNPLAAATDIAGIVGGIISLFGDQPDVNMMILEEVRDLRKLVERMYREMGENFADVKARLDSLHKQLDWRLQDMEKQLLHRFDMLQAIALEQGEGVSRLSEKLDRKDARDVERHHRARSNDARSALDYRREYNPGELPFGPVTRRIMIGITNYACRNACELGGSKTISGEFASCDFSQSAYEALCPGLPLSAKINTLAAICERAGSPLCTSARVLNEDSGKAVPTESILLANYTMWLEGADELERLLQFHGKAYDESHADRRGTRHAEALTILRHGYQLQEAFQNSVWNSDTQGKGALNRNLISKLLHNYEARYDDISKLLKSRHDLYLKEVREIDNLALADKLTPEATFDISPEITRCEGFRNVRGSWPEGSTPKLTVSPEQRLQLLSQIPREASVLKALQGGELELCYGDIERWEEEEVRLDSPRPSSYPGCEFIQEWQFAKPAVVIRAQVKTGPQKYQVFAKKLTFPQKLRFNLRTYHRKIKSPAELCSGSDNNERAPERDHPEDHAKLWVEEIKRRWEDPKDSLSNLLSNAPEVDDVRTRTGAMSLRKFLDDRRKASIEKLVSHIDRDFKEKSPAIFSSLQGLEGARRIVDDYTQLAYPTLRDSKTPFGVAYEKLQGTQGLVRAIIAKSDSARAEFNEHLFDDIVKEHRDSVSEARRAFERTLREMEKDAIRDFVKSRPDLLGNNAAALDAYRNEYGQRSPFRSLGKHALIDERISKLEALVSREGDPIILEEIKRAHQVRHELTPESVWGTVESDLTRHRTVGLCEKEGYETLTGGHMQLSQSEMEKFDAQLLKSFSTEQALAYGIGLLQMKACYRVTGDGSVSVFVAVTENGGYPNADRGDFTRGIELGRGFGSPFVQNAILRVQISSPLERQAVKPSSERIPIASLEGINDLKARSERARQRRLSPAEDLAGFLEPLKKLEP